MKRIAFGILLLVTTAAMGQATQSAEPDWSKMEVETLRAMARQYFRVSQHLESELTKTQGEVSSLKKVRDEQREELAQLKEAATRVPIPPGKIKPEVSSTEATGSEFRERCEAARLDRIRVVKERIAETEKKPLSHFGSVTKPAAIAKLRKELDQLQREKNTYIPTIGDKGSLKTGDFGRFKVLTFTIRQVVDKQAVIVDVSDYARFDAWVSGIDTKNLVDGEFLAGLKGIYEVMGTKTYSTANNSTRTIMHIHKIAD